MSKRKLLKSEDIRLPNKSRYLVNWNWLFEHLYAGYEVTKADIKDIIIEASKLFAEEPNLIYLQDPVTIVGDIHGQFFDLREIIKLGGRPNESKYLFLGDYVDRGLFGVEVIIALYALKINHPNTIFLLRGNHESRMMTQTANFRQECCTKYDQEIYDLIIDSFDRMPLACLINGHFFAVHGGISPTLDNIAEIHKIPRVGEPPKTGVYCDLLWSDPFDNETGNPEMMWIQNVTRHCSYYFGYRAITNFLRQNELLTLIRAHEVQFEGFKSYCWQNREFPQVMTIFSAPNYCDVYGNKGAIMKIVENNLQVYQYNFTQKPDLLLCLGHAFTWSISIVSKNLMDMFIAFLESTNDAVMQNTVKDDISMLDEAVLRALDIQNLEKSQIQQQNLSSLEIMVEEQRRKRISGTAKNAPNSQNPNASMFGHGVNDVNKMFNESLPDHFSLIKSEDQRNDSMPKV